MHFHILQIRFARFMNIKGKSSTILKTYKTYYTKFLKLNSINYVPFERVQFHCLRNLFRRQKFGLAVNDCFRNYIVIM